MLFSDTAPHSPPTPSSSFLMYIEKIGELGNEAMALLDIRDLYLFSMYGLH